LHYIQTLQHPSVVGQEIPPVCSDEIVCATLGGLVVQHDLMAAAGSTPTRKGVIRRLHPTTGSIDHHVINQLLSVRLATSRIVSTRLSLSGRPTLSFVALLLSLHLRSLGPPLLFGPLLSFLGPALGLGSPISLRLSILSMASFLLRQARSLSLALSPKLLLLS
jgi:hypothetical protein